MKTTLKSFEVRNANGEVVSKFSLVLNGYTYELHTAREIILTGIEAERHFLEVLEDQRTLAAMMGLSIVITK